MRFYKNILTMKIVICPDSFKGSLNSIEISEIIAEILKKEIPNLEIITVPLADGGEGTAEIIKNYGYPNVKVTMARDPLNRNIPVKYYTDKKEEKIFIESAEIIGLPLLKKEERNPFVATSYGLGEIIKEAISKGAKEITVSLGGSATCDGGKGMLLALENFKSNHVKFRIICDVNNPLLGNEGAVMTFAIQKGAKVNDLPILEKRITEFVDYLISKGICKQKDVEKKGAGAAGGLGFTFQTIFNAETLKGIDFIMSTVNFDSKIRDASFLISGEGKIDKQSLMGKVLNGVLRKGKESGIPVIALGGIVEDKEDLINSGIDMIYEIRDKNLSLEENMKPEKTKENIKKAIKELLKNNIFKQKE